MIFSKRNQNLPKLLQTLLKNGIYADAYKNSKPSTLLSLSLHELKQTKYCKNF